MKKFTYIILAASMLLATGCSNELETTMQDGKLSFSSVSASMADLPTSRAHLEGGGKVVWDAGDNIGIYSDTQTTPVMFTCTNVSESNATFTSDGEVSGSNFFAYYPYENSKIVDGKIEYTLSNSTSYKEGSFYRQCPVIAKSNSNEFSFKQTCGILSFSISGSQTIEKLKLASNYGEPVSGNGLIDLESGTPIFTISKSSSSGYSTEVEMVVNKKLSLDETVVFYFIVPITKYSKGITLTISGKTDTGESFSLCKTTSKAVEISRGVIKSFSVVDTDELIEDYQSTIYSKLMAFYNATGGDNWTNNTNWGSDKPFKEWYGITADDIFVTGLQLNDNNLTGAISGELNDLHFLQDLYIRGNALSSIKINSCSNLAVIDCVNNSSLKTLNVSHNSHLVGLVCHDNIISDLNLTGCTGLQSLQAYNNQITTLDLTGCSNIRTLNVNNNLLTQLDVSSCPQLVNIDCSNNQITTLNVVELSKLDHLSCRGCVLKNLKVSDCTSLRTLLCDFNQITSSALSITNCPNLETLWCHQNKLETLDVTPFTKLKTLWCGNHESFEGNAISTLDISKNTLLESFSCYGMKLTSLDVSKNTNLWKFECSGNSITALDVNNLSGLKELWCHTMKLSDNIDVSENSSLEYLSCFNNPDLTKIYIDSPDQVFSYVKDDATKFCIKGSDVLYDEFPYYTSTDYSKDGTVTLLQQATIGKGIDIVLMGDAYSDRLIADGSYDKVMRTAMESFFSEEPYKSFRDYFNVYSVAVVSANEQYAGATSTAFSCYFGGGTHVGGNDEKVFTYAQKAIGEDQVEDAVIIVMMNAATYAGTCYMYYPQATNDYGKGASISYFPIGTDETMLEQVLHHEAGGHGFAKLGDEYFGWSDKNDIPNDKIEEIQLLSTYGWLKNIDLTSNPLTVKWNKFLSDTYYANEDIGVFEGAYDYNYGVYRPSYNSIMQSNWGGFNAPSREAIYYRINKLAYGEDWTYDYETFVEYDAINRTSTASRAVINFKQMPPLHEPIIIKGSWKDAKSKVSSRSVLPLNNNASNSNSSSLAAVPSMTSTISHRVTLPDGKVMVTTVDSSGKTAIEYEND